MGGAIPIATSEVLMGIASLHPSFEIEHAFVFSRRDAPGVLQENLTL
jgi:hypothetical protein